MEVIQEMGMTDKQFKSWLRRIKRDLQEAREAEDTETKNKKIDEMLEDIQADLED